uniref:L1 transposable element RRM domain-containing protein n=1 Tax=Sinocyclocheilus rhinocerous TaxID=307959 RepID=A0A673I964_9TELE
MADNESVSAQLTIESLVKELEKFRKDMTGEFVTLLNSSLEPIRDRITQLEQDVNAIQSKLTIMEKENTVLKANVEDLVSRSKRHNIRVVGLPEGIEGKSLDCAHRSLRPKPRTEEAPRPLIIRFHRYIVKETVMRWAKSHKVISYKGHQIKMYEDFSTELAKKRAAFNKIKSLLYKQGARFGIPGQTLWTNTHFRNGMVESNRYKLL